jgi:heat shock protein HtpX
MVERLSRQAQLPMPKVYVIPDPSPNAFATGRNPSHAAVAATEGSCRSSATRARRRASRTSWRTCKHRDILISSVAATIAAAIMLRRDGAVAAMFGGYGGRGDRDRGNNPIALLATIILAPIAAMLIQMAISRSREFSADAGGAQIAGNPYGLADALRKIDAGRQARAARRQPGHGAHVHREAVLGRRPVRFSAATRRPRIAFARCLAASGRNARPLM